MGMNMMWIIDIGSDATGRHRVDEVEQDAVADVEASRLGDRLEIVGYTNLMIIDG